MTVQQEHPTTAAPQAAPDVRVPAQRRADHDTAARTSPAAAPLPRGWGSEEDRVMARRMVAFMTAVGLYAGVFVGLGSRVW